VSERDLIEEAFGNTIKTLFSEFFHAYTAARGDEVGERQAEQIFSAGITHARHVRARAIAVLP
jgi:hypothetical protein